MVMTYSGKGSASERRPSHNSNVFHGTRIGDTDTSGREVAISTILGALAMEPNHDKAEANLLNLLIVDDERSIREGCRDVAQGIGYSTYIADNASTHSVCWIPPA